MTRSRETGASRRVRLRTSSLNLVSALGRGRMNLPWKVDPKNSNTSITATMLDLAGHVQPDVGQNGPHQAIGGFVLSASISQDHEVFGVFVPADGFASAPFRPPVTRTPWASATRISTAKSSGRTYTSSSSGLLGVHAKDPPDPKTRGIPPLYVQTVRPVK